MLRILNAFFALILFVVPVWADSTINPDLPADGQPYSAPVVRGQFDATRNDVNALQSLNIGMTQPFACNLANAGRMWIDKSVNALWKLNYCDGSGATWVPGGYIDTIKHLFTPPTGRGECASIVAAPTTELGSVPQSCINVTGNSNIAITSFGATAKAGDIKVVSFTGINTLVYNAVSMVLPGAVNAATSVADNWIFQSTGLGNWIAVSRSSRAAVTVVAAPGTGTRIRAFLNIAAPSITVTADGFIVCTALSNGACFELGDYSQIFNGNTIGVGGMDTGNLPVSGYVCIYAIYNPVTAARSVLGVNCATSSTTIYSGTHLPSGYTASALIASWPTNGVQNMVAGLTTDRTFTYQNGITALSGSTTNNASPVAISISSSVPPNATWLTGVYQVVANGSQAAIPAITLGLLPTSVFIPANGVNGFSTPIAASTVQHWDVSFPEVGITAPQTTYYYSAGLTANVLVGFVISTYRW